MKRRITTEDNFAYLTVALLMFLFIGALSDQLAWEIGDLLIEAATVLTLAIGIWSIKSERRWFRTGIGLTTALLLVVATGALLEAAELHLAHLLIMLVFFVLTAVLAFQQIIFADTIDTNKLVGAVCIYILLAMIFGMLYLMVESLFPGSFSGLSAGKWQGDMSRMVYFSFVTLTTLGYGDILPTLPLASFLVYLQAVTGQFYIAILVASMVSAHIAGRQR